MKHYIIIITISILLLSSSSIYGCMIAGVDSGECKEYEENRDYMPFCGKYTRYRACVPKRLVNTMYEYVLSFLVNHLEIMKKNVKRQLMEKNVLLQLYVHQV